MNSESGFRKEKECVVSEEYYFYKAQCESKKLNKIGAENINIDIGFCKPNLVTLKIKINF